MVTVALAANGWIDSCCSLLPSIFSRPPQHALWPIKLRFQSTESVIRSISMLKQVVADEATEAWGDIIRSWWTWWQ